MLALRGCDKKNFTQGIGGFVSIAKGVDRIMHQTSGIAALANAIVSVSLQTSLAVYENIGILVTGPKVILEAHLLVAVFTRAAVE